MLAAVFEGNGRLELKEFPVPRLERADDVLLEVEAASICGTDIQILKVPPGHPATPGAILGHEYVGRVLEAGKDCIAVKPGDKVAVDPNITCGSCRFCQSGRHNMCENMTTLGIFINGGFAKYNVAPAGQLYPYSPDLEPELAVFAEPLSCVVNAFQKIQVFPGETAVVLGAGPIGQYFIQLCAIAGAGKVIVSEPQEMRRNFARQSGATRVIHPENEDVEKIILSETQGGADVVIDAVGFLADLAIRLACRGARIMLFGQNATARTTIAQNHITRNELTIFGSYIAKHTFPSALRILESKRLKLKPLITHRLKLPEIQKGMEAMRSGQAMKVIISP